MPPAGMRDTIKQGCQLPLLPLFLFLDGLSMSADFSAALAVYLSAVELTSSDSSMHTRTIFTHKLNCARGAVTHFLSVASRTPPQAAEIIKRLPNSPKRAAKKSRKTAPLEKACLFPPPMLHYQHSGLK